MIPQGSTYDRVHTFIDELINAWSPACECTKCNLYITKKNNTEQKRKQLIDSKICTADSFKNQMKNNHEKSIILCVKFQRRAIFSFSFYAIF